MRRLGGREGAADCSPTSEAVRYLGRGVIRNGLATGKMKEAAN